MEGKISCGHKHCGLNGTQGARWRSAWFCPDTKHKIRADWSNNFQAYMDNCVLDPGTEDIADDIQQAMMLFRRFEAQLPKTNSALQYWKNGTSSVTAAIEDITTGATAVQPNADCVLVSLDLAGGNKNGISEIGWATVDMRDLLALKHQATGRDLIKTRNVVVGKPRKDDRKFLFRTTEYVDSEALVQTTKEIFSIEDDLNPGKFREIVLLGHSINGDLSDIANLGIGLTDLPTIRGKVDTHFEPKRFWETPAHCILSCDS